MLIDDVSASTGSVRYRLAEPADGRALARLRWEFHVEDHDDPAVDDLGAFTDRFLEFWGVALAERRWTVWVAEIDARIAANVWIYLIDKVPRPVAGPTALGYVTNVYAVPGRRDQGVGAGLLTRVITWATEQELELLMVWPSERSVPFYERAGFRPSDEILELHLRGS